MRKNNKIEEELKVLEWISEHADVDEIDDKPFRDAFLKGMNRPFSPRRFEIHNSDLIYCLTGAIVQKVMPPTYTDEDYGTIMRWTLGKGVEIGVVNSLKKVLHADSQKLVRVGKSVGSVDLDLEGQSYEITTAMFFGSKKNPRFHPPPHKVLQEISYLCSGEITEGKVKVYILMPPKEEVLANDCPSLPSLRRQRVRYERTWLIKLKDNYFKKLFEGRSELAYKALMTGDLTILPASPYFEWKCKYCSIVHNGDKMTVCEFLCDYYDDFQKAWALWDKDRSTFILKRWSWRLRRRNRMSESFEYVYGREPTDEEITTFIEYIKRIRWY
jgi:hypothetical protein